MLATASTPKLDHFSFSHTPHVPITFWCTPKYKLWKINMLLVVITKWFIYLFQFRKDGLRSQQAMIHAIIIMWKPTSIGRMFKKHYMPMSQKSPTGGLFAGNCIFWSHKTFFAKGRWRQHQYFFTITNIKLGFSNSTPILRSWQDAPHSMVPTLNKLVAGGLRIWIYR